MHLGNLSRQRLKAMAVKNADGRDVGHGGSASRFLDQLSQTFAWGALVIGGFN
jgi:hypothetical protein